MFRDTSAQDRVVERASFWKRRRLPIAIALLIVIGIVMLAPGLARLWSAEKSVSASRLSIATVERGRFVRDIAAEGRVVAAVSPTLYAAAAGTVSFEITAGHDVAQGEVLGTIESPELESELAQERSALQAMTVDYRRAQLDARQKALVADETLEKARIDRNAAATEQARTQKAFDLGVIPEIEVMRTQAALDKAEVAYKHAQSDRGLQSEGLAFEVDAKRLARDRQALLVKDLDRKVDLLSLHSPVSGQVGQLLVAERAYVAKDTPLLTVVDLSALEVELKVPESFARDLAVGMPAEIRGSGREFTGEVGAVSPEVVSGEVTARVRFTGDAPQGLRQNQRLSVRVLLDARDDVLMVARGPFLESGGGNSGYVVQGDIAERRVIHTGAASIDKVEVLDGLQVGERIVISGSDNFDGAQRVVISR
ncbi:efflux RND transporter periplasmic adaptor subunit [Algiphilus sp. W345]|uniref:Efflux RND transporter periplasmic adaptor subunit n=1 Tax=Banduia mediterranea TaxID=3075609 RepID=A0ABU2WIG9_9GAMM|nr:HlyD family efflux transporter periplasmic adaptor subunit [Algiphilus sp. W345]MDT0497429.1 efflux RND transporter periplasmic adaptor subunit [Algiphilus sp. W345]